MIIYNLQDLTRRVNAYYDLMIIAKNNKNLADYEKFRILYNSAVKDKERYFKDNVK